MWPVTQSYQAWRQIPLKRVLSSCQRLCERCSFSRGSEKGSGCIVIYAYNEISGWFLSSSEGSPATPGMKYYSFARLLMYTSVLAAASILAWLVQIRVYVCVSGFSLGWFSCSLSLQKGAQDSFFFICHNTSHIKEGKQHTRPHTSIAHLHAYYSGFSLNISLCSAGERLFWAPVFVYICWTILPDNKQPSFLFRVFDIIMSPSWHGKCT